LVDRTIGEKRKLCGTARALHASGLHIAGQKWFTQTRSKKGDTMKRLWIFSFTTFFILLVAILTLWSTLALWFRLPLPETARMVVAGVFALFGLAIVRGLFGKRPRRALVIFGLVFAAVFLWWGTIKPPMDGNWEPDNARQVTGVIDQDILTLTNIREFEWRSEDDFSEIWTTQNFDLSQITSVDMFMTYWGGPHMAHVMLSFGFVDAPHLVLSVEVRREIGGDFHPIPDFFKTHTRINIASVESDVVGVRANIRGHDAKLYRLNTSPDLARQIIEEFVRDANSLAAEPQFFNSIFKNCTTAIAEILQAAGVNVPLSWRIVLNGHLPSLVYAHGLMDTRFTLDELRERGRINGRAKQAGLGAGFSAAIRQGVPDPKP
jgi:hypothetical protein